ncbi:MAG: TIGR00282 family metallophosphoesterase [Eubacteriaceae bacterium]|nr:TIGR00282 family metallophosphoesterase [Eubacteriaceae bacterium]MDD4507731.1 TIGR00282 family metallophosphoesterase [Eubacteriaceae bacterium]
MKLLMIGDVVGRPGRRVLKDHLQELQEIYHIDVTIVNGENASGGNGLTEKNAKELLALPIDVITMGNHVWKQKDTVNFIGNYSQILRPMNYPDGSPGRGYGFFDWHGTRACVLNVSGQIFMEELDSPFAAIDRVLEDIKREADLFIVDFHAETTSEKIALGYDLDGTATVVAGTHTHVQTADARVLAGGTAYITDLGMTGPLNGVLGVEKEIIIRKMRTKQPERFTIEKQKPWQINGIVVDMDESTGRARTIERVYRIYEEQQ